MSAWNGDMTARAAGLIDSWKSRGIEQRGIETSTQASETSSRMQWEGLGGAFDLQQDQRATMQSMTINGIPDFGIPDMTLTASRVEQHLSFDAMLELGASAETSVIQSTESTISAVMSAETEVGNILAAFNATYSTTVEALIPASPTGVMTQSVEYDSVAETFDFSAADGSFSMSGGTLLEERSSVVSTPDGVLEMTDATSLTETMSMHGDGYSLDMASQTSTSITQLTDIAPDSGCEFASVTEFTNSDEQTSFSSGDMTLDFSHSETTQMTLTSFSPTDPGQSDPALPDMPGSFACAAFPDLNLQLPTPADSPLNLGNVQGSFSANFDLSLDMSANFDVAQTPFATATDLGGQIGASIQRPMGLGIGASF